MKRGLVERATPTRSWTLREDNHSHHHGRVLLTESPLYLQLSWRRTTADEVVAVGVYRLDLPALLDGGYIRYDPESSVGAAVRLRIVRAEGRFFVQARQDGPRVELTRDHAVPDGFSNGRWY